MSRPVCESANVRAATILLVAALGVGGAVADEPATPRTIPIEAPASGADFDKQPEKKSPEASLKAPESKSADKTKVDDKAKADPDEDKKSDKKLEEELAKAKKANEWSVKFSGHVQLEYVNWMRAGPGIANANDYFEFRRLRLVADGTGYGNCDFRLQFTMEPESVGESPAGTVVSPDMKDAYFSINEIPGIGRFRIGHFFVPFSLEQVTNDTNNIFLERSIPSQGVFAADREVGIALYNCTPNQRATWTYGAFLDSIGEGLKERIDDNQGYRLAGRFTCLPYCDDCAEGRRLVHAGFGVLHTRDQDRRVRFRARPQIHEGPRAISSDVLDADSYTTGNLELAIVWEAVALQAEAFLAHVNLVDGQRKYVGGAYAHLSWFLTGESRQFEKFGQHGAQFGRNKPITNFRLDRCGSTWGAWEAKARWSYLDLNTVDAGQYNDLTLGLNWYWSDRTRVMLDWIHPMTTSDTLFAGNQVDILGVRFDWNW